MADHILDIISCGYVEIATTMNLVAVRRMRQQPCPAQFHGDVFCNIKTYGARKQQPHAYDERMHFCKSGRAC